MASTTPDSLYHIIGDTVVRRSIIDAYIELEIGQARGPTCALPFVECEKVLAATVHRLQKGKFSSPIDDEPLPRLGPEPYHGWIWSDEHAKDIFGRDFRYLMKQWYGAVSRIPRTDEIATLEKGARLLHDLLPLLMPSALSHAHVIACVPDTGNWKGVSSSSQFILGGTIFLGNSINGGLWGVAEHLFHEALHQKLYDFQHGHLLLGLDSATDRPRVRSLWTPQQLNDANLWDIKRVFAAFHVYVHLSLLSLVAEQRASELEDVYGQFKGMIKSVTALERAHYLGEKLKEHWDQLGPAGKNLAEWLISALEFLDPNPPPKGVYMHLYLSLQKRG